MTIRLLALAFAAWLGMCGALPALAENALPAKAHEVCARFPASAPSAVTVDVLEVGGSQIGNDVSATKQTLDAADSDIWCLDLDTVSGFAATCDLTTYAVRFVPDAADCSTGGSPSLCVEHTIMSGGAECWGFDSEQTVVYPTAAIPSRGITQTVINRGNPSYIKHDVKIDEASIVFTWYQVFYYDASARVEETRRSLTVPNP